MDLKTKKNSINSVRKKIGKAIEEYGLIKENDRIIVGISGGKDSQILLENLAYRKRMLPFDFELFAVHIQLENMPYEIDYQQVNDFCASLNVPFKVQTSSIDFSIESNKTVCFICSWTRRKELFKAAKELNCNKIALGHHLDDSLETLFMNMSFQGEISAIPPILTMRKWDCTFIRPLILVSKSELNQYADIQGYTGEKTVCPYGKETKRAEVRKIIADLQVLFPHVKTNLYNAMRNVKTEYLPNKLV